VSEPVRRPQRPCATFGCAGLVSGEDRYCEACQARPRRREYDDHRPSAAKRGYGHRWRVYSRWYLRQHPLCVECERAGRVKASTDVDHIEAVDGPDDPLFWDETNHQALCHECHSAKTCREDGGFGR
jgi:5-methylcytosine-specific restriction protein A